MFEGIRVLEVGAWVMVPAAGSLLADYGADVIKIEHPSRGDPARALVTGGRSSQVGSVDLMIEQTNRGKRSIGLDISTPDGREVLYELVKRSDVFLTNMLPAVRRKLMVDVDDIRAHNPNIVYARADAVGSDGPEAGKPGFDSAVFFGRAGILNSLSVDGALPQPRPSFGDKTAALSLAFGIASALLKRERTGEPSVVETSLLGTAMWVASSDILYSQINGVDFHSIESTSTNPLARRYMTSDGRTLLLAMLSPDPYWVPLCEALERPDLATDPRFATSVLRKENADACIAELAATFGARPLEYWRGALAGFGGAWEVVQDSLEAGRDPQAIANGYIETVVHPSGTEMPAIRAPLRVDGGRHDIKTAPAAWEHTDEVLLELGLGWDRLIELKLADVIT